ncbi:MAG TPA: hypothetical protein VFN87_15770 [Solirubrobacteraceae bacterium]|nr:hypothetical protein [Solirubrobacteraceae bacterium]
MRITSSSIVGLAACVVLGAGAAGCGSQSPTSTANQSAKSPVAMAYAYSRCMRANGVPNFPDPKVSSSPGQMSIKLAVSVQESDSPKFGSAQKACQHLAPGPQTASPAQRRAQAQAFLAFARCLRSHGLSRFPDPNSQGQITRQMISAAGIDLHQPAVLAAAKACVSVTHGVITKADVERAVNGPH